MLAYHVENRLTPPPLHQMRMHGKIAGQKRCTFTVEELEKIGEILGGKYFFGFEFPDGTKV